MGPNFQTSFIPKKPIVAERAAAVRPVGVFTVLAIFILFAVLLASVGLFLYKGILVKNIEKMKADLTTAQNRFEPSKINELQQLSKRLTASSEVLAQHIAVTPIFQALSAVTMKTVRFTQFSYVLGDDKNSKVNIKLSGMADGYASVALQSDLFTTKEEAKNFIDPVFSNLSLDDKGNVLFNLDFSVDPSFVDYKTTLLTE